MLAMQQTPQSRMNVADAVAVVAAEVVVALEKVKQVRRLSSLQCSRKTHSRPQIPRKTKSWPTRLPKRCPMGLMKKQVAMSHVAVVVAVVAVAIVTVRVKTQDRN